MENEAKYQSGFAYRIIEYFSIFNFLSTMLCCKKCHGDVTFHQSCSRGLGFKLVLTCKNCQPASVDSSPLTNNGAFYDINLRIVLASRLLGIYADGIIEFCAVMDFPLIISQLYDGMERTICDAVKNLAEVSMKRAVELEKKELKQRKEKGLTVLDWTSWPSQLNNIYGYIFLFAQHTRKIIDFETLDTFPSPTDIFSSSRDSDSVEIRKNKYENKAVVAMISRSEKQYGVQYEKYIVNKGSNIFEEIKRATPFKNITVKKSDGAKNYSETLHPSEVDSILSTIAPDKSLLEDGDLAVETAAYISVCYSNDGSKSVMKIMESLGLIVGENCYNYYIEREYADD